LNNFNYEIQTYLQKIKSLSEELESEKTQNKNCLIERDLEHIKDLEGLRSTIENLES
jgi:hypothetical protein